MKMQFDSIIHKIRLRSYLKLRISVSYISMLRQYVYKLQFITIIQINKSFLFLEYHIRVTNYPNIIYRSIVLIFKGGFWLWRACFYILDQEPVKNCQGGIKCLLFSVYHFAY